MKKTISIFIYFLIISYCTTAIGDEVTFVSFNVWHGIDTNGIFKMGEYEVRERRDTRYKLLVSGLKDLNPDIIGIQEANELPSYAKRLAGSIGYNTVWKVGNAGVKLFGLGIPINFSEGIAVLSKKAHSLKYLDARRLSGSGIQRDYFSCHLSEVRNAIAVKAIIGNRPLIIFNIHTHFSLLLSEKWEKKVDSMHQKGEITLQEKDEIIKKIKYSYERTENDIMELLSFVREITREYNYPYVIMGDFNATTESPALQKLFSKLNLYDPFLIRNPTAFGYTWNPSVNTNTAYDGSPYWADGKTLRDPLSRIEADFDRTTPRRIDFIFLSRHFKPEKIKKTCLIFTKPANGVFASDHFGVMVIVDGIP